MESPRIVVDIAILAHQEEATIASVIEDLAAQSAATDPRLDLRVCVAANGCRDKTVEVARAAVARLPAEVSERFVVLDLAQSGKSRTLNALIHTHLRREAEIFVFMDGDIGLVEPDTIGRIVQGLATRPELRIFTGRPVKDIAHYGIETGAVGRLIASGAEQLTDFRRSLAGGLYGIRASAARSVHLPIGLPVEDGFIRAMVVTDFLTRPDQLDRIDGDPGVFFIYESIRTVPALVRHQTRIVVGSAINAMLFARIRKLAPTPEAAQALLREAASDEQWLQRALREELPKAPHGYVPFHFMTKRIRRFDRKLLAHPSKFFAFLGGIGLDVIAWVNASRVMMSGRAAGHW
jgi:glycosyltransferase involved in cell wall biosynthesis